MKIDNFYIAKLNDDGTYSEPVKLSEVKDLTLSSCEENHNNFDCVISGDFCGEIKINNVSDELMNVLREEFDAAKRKGQFINWEKTIYEAQCKRKSCLTCRNCKEMYHYPGFVTAEECICEVGFKCDTHFDMKENCQGYVKREWNEPQKRNPDLDIYPYVIR